MKFPRQEDHPHAAPAQLALDRETGDARQVLRVHIDAARARRSHGGETVQDVLAEPATVDVGIEGAVGRAFRQVGAEPSQDLQRGAG
jgi:hypothetical protein